MPPTPPEKCETPRRSGVTQIQSSTATQESADSATAQVDLRQALNAWHFEAPQITREFAERLIPVHFEPPGFTQDFTHEYLDLSEWEGNERLMFDYLIGTNNTGFLSAVVQDELRDLQKSGWRFIASASDDECKARFDAWVAKKKQHAEHEHRDVDVDLTRDFEAARSA